MKTRGLCIKPNDPPHTHTHTHFVVASRAEVTDVVPTSLLFYACVEYAVIMNGRIPKPDLDTVLLGWGNFEVQAQPF